VIWDPKVYYFSVIPNRVEPVKAVIVMTSGVVASVVGALVPALKAAYMDPVKAIRFE
jgi:lipoprotein-releasing system permease protein